MDIVSLKCDYCFKEWISDETVRRYFISDVLDIPIENIKSVRLVNTSLWKRYREQKQGILDILAELNDDTKLNIEMQIKFMSYWDKRSLFYLAKMYTEDLKAGEKYTKLKRCIGINILDFNLTKGDQYHTVYRLRDEEGNEFSDILEIHIIELGKKLKGTEKVDDWIRLINAENTEDLSMIQVKHPGIRAAIEKIKWMSLSRGLRLRYEAYLKEKRDAWAIADYEEKKRKEFEEKKEEFEEKEKEFEEKEKEFEEKEKAFKEERKEFEEEEKAFKEKKKAFEQKVKEMKGQEEEIEERGKKIEEKFVREKAEDILEILKSLGEVPKDLEENLFSEKDIIRLKTDFKTAVKASSIEEFREKTGR